MCGKLHIYTIMSVCLVCSFLLILAAMALTAILLLPSCRGKRPTRVIIDTDVGDDIDDALAILVAAAMHRVGVIKIVAVITSGHGQHYTRAKLVRRLIRAVLGTCDVAIIMGRERLGTTKGNYMICGRYVFAGKFPRLGDSEKRWLLRTIRSEYRRGQPVKFLCIGPLHNLRYIAPPRGTFELTLMGGCFERFFDGANAPSGFAEYNVKRGVSSWQWALREYHETALIVPLDVAGVCRFAGWRTRLPDLYRAYRDIRTVLGRVLRIFRAAASSKALSVGSFLPFSSTPPLFSCSISQNAHT